MAAKAENGGRGGIRWRLVGWSGAAVLLALPAVAMRFTEEVNWTPSDFVFAALLFGGVGLGLELAFRRSRTPAYRAGAALALATAFMIVWGTGAVGIIGGEREDANVLYAGVLAVALLGALIGVFRPAGMARAMTAAAVAQGLVPPAALVLGWAPPVLVASTKVIGLTGLFVAMWLAAAWLFRRAGGGR